MDIATDKEGFLSNYLEWSPDIAPQLAEEEGITLTEAHWDILYLVRDYYQEHHIAPPARVISKIVGKNLGLEKSKSIYLMGLFTGKPAKMIAKLAGLPKPSNCD